MARPKVALQAGAVIFLVQVAMKVTIRKTLMSRSWFLLALIVAGSAQADHAHEILYQVSTIDALADRGLPASGQAP